MLENIVLKIFGRVNRQTSVLNESLKGDKITKSALQIVSHFQKLTFLPIFFYKKPKFDRRVPLITKIQQADDTTWRCGDVQETRSPAN